MHIYQFSLVLVQNCESMKYIFESLANFKNQNTRFVPIDFEFLKSVFEILAIAQCALAIAFLVHVLCKHCSPKRFCYSVTRTKVKRCRIGAKFGAE